MKEGTAGVNGVDVIAAAGGDVDVVFVTTAVGVDVLAFLTTGAGEDVLATAGVDAEDDAFITKDAIGGATSGSNKTLVSGMAADPYLVQAREGVALGFLRSRSSGVAMPFNAAIMVEAAWDGVLGGAMGRKRFLPVK